MIINGNAIPKQTNGIWTENDKDCSWLASRKYVPCELTSDAARANGTPTPYRRTIRMNKP